MAAGMSRKMPKAACLLSVGMHSAIMCKRLVSNTLRVIRCVGEKWLFTLRIVSSCRGCFVAVLSYKKFTLKKSRWVLVF